LCNQRRRQCNHRDFRRDRQRRRLNSRRTQKTSRFSLGRLPMRLMRRLPMRLLRQLSRSLRSPARSELARRLLTPLSRRPLRAASKFPRLFAAKCFRVWSQQPTRRPSRTRKPLGPYDGHHPSRSRLSKPHDHSCCGSSPQSHRGCC
jgi:hypothetical protein